MNYSQLTATEKATLTRLLTAKQELEQAQRKMYKAIERTMELAKKAGTLNKNGILVEYKPETSYTTLDTAKLKQEMPELMEQFGKTVNRKETLAIVK